MDIRQLLEQHVDVDTEQKSWRGEFRPKGYIGKDDLPDGTESGYYSVVRRKRNDPHVAQKRAKDPIKAHGDSYWKFISYVVEHKLWDNPYFPRIYKKKNITDTRGRDIPSIEMENLVKFSSISRSEAEAIIRNIFGEDILDKIAPKRTPLGEIAENLALFIESMAKGNWKYKWELSYHSISLSRNYIKDDNLIDAIDTLTGISRQIRGAMFDFNRDNIMVRRTSVGKQLVITDPLH